MALLPSVRPRGRARLSYREGFDRTLPEALTPVRVPIVAREWTIPIEPIRLLELPLWNLKSTAYIDLMPSPFGNDGDKVLVLRSDW